MMKQAITIKKTKKKNIKTICFSNAIPIFGEATGFPSWWQGEGIYAIYYDDGSKAFFKAFLFDDVVHVQ